MARLTFIGLGLGRAGDISLSGIDAARGCDVVFAEFYTSRLVEHDIDRISQEIGKEVVELSRGEVEGGERLLEAAMKGNAGLLTAGDPLTATTHQDLRLRALERGIEVRVVHSSSILTAAPGLLGLQHYKFGRTVTVPFPQEGYSPTSPYDGIAENLGIGLHTLVLLDIDSEGGRYMTAGQGIRELLRMEGEVGSRVFTEDTLVCVVARAGGDDALLDAGPAGELAGRDHGGPPHSLVVPGKMHFMEEEALERLCGYRKA